MEDKWKKFIDENREEFDNEIPKDNFHLFADKLPMENQPKMVRLSLVWQMAAAFIILIGVGLYFILQNFNSSSTVAEKSETTPIKDNRLVLAKMDPQLAETEFYYVSQIDDLMEEVDKHELNDDVKELLKQLDKEFDLLKKEMGDQVNSDQIVQALIENYRLKIKLLEKILDSYVIDNTNENEENLSI